MTPSSSQPDDRPLAAVILAAGRGTRMNADLPKVVHAVAGRPMVAWVVDAVRESGAHPIVLVIGYGQEHVRACFEGNDADLVYAHQEQPRGTGHATQCAAAALTEFDGDVLVLAGDGPLIRVDTLRTMCRVHRETRATATLATSVIADPTGYGRIIRDGRGRFEAIVEDRNLRPDQRDIREVYPSYAVFDRRRLFDTLETLTPNAVSGEFYLTDVPGLLRKRGERVELVEAVPPEDVLSINTPDQLAEVERILCERTEASRP